jgi:uncharacterized protein with von Willebrand factor type A (vWA) domain
MYVPFNRSTNRGDLQIGKQSTAGQGGFTWPPCDARAFHFAQLTVASLRTQHARRLVGRRTVVLVITDGLDTGEPDDLDRELAWLRRRSRRLLWLNPLLRFEGYAPLARGASVLHRHADGMLAVHNLSRLEELAASLAALMKS